jgi:hypothetical protein
LRPVHKWGILADDLRAAATDARSKGRGQMGTRAVLASMALAILASCASTPGSKGAPDGPPWSDEKQIDVGVGRGFGSGKLEIEVAELETLAADNKAVVWSLRASAANYEFAGVEGIKFETPSGALPLACDRAGDPKDFAGQCEALGQNRLLRCTKPRSAPGTCYKYTVILKPRAGGTPLYKDPWIMEQ